MSLPQEIMASHENVSSFSLGNWSIWKKLLTLPEWKAVYIFDEVWALYIGWGLDYTYFDTQDIFFGTSLNNKALDSLKISHWLCCQVIPGANNSLLIVFV